MNRTAEEIEAEVLQLSATERARLAERLVASLEPGLAEDPRAIETAWLEEANRRYGMFVRGESNATPAEQVFDELLSARD